MSTLPTSFGTPPLSVDSQSQDMKINIALVVLVILFISCTFVLLCTFYIFYKMIQRFHSGYEPMFRTSAIVSESQPQSNGGLNLSAVASLPTFSFTALYVNDKDGGVGKRHLVDCAVCLSEFADGEQGRMLPACQHRFHVECIDMWLFSNPTCPLCRAQVEPGLTSTPARCLNEQREEAEQRLESVRDVACGFVQRSGYGNSPDALESTSHFLPADEFLNQLLLRENAEVCVSVFHEHPCSSSHETLQRTKPQATMEVS